MNLQIERRFWTPTSRQRSEVPADTVTPDYRRLASASLAPPLPSSFRALALQPEEENRREEEDKKRGRFLVLHLWELPNRDWWGGVWELVSPKYIYWPPLTTLGKRWFWVFSLISYFNYKLLGFLGKGFRRHQKTLQQLLILTNNSETVAGGETWGRQDAPQTFLQTLPNSITTANNSSPRDLAGAQKRSMWF